jgi:hypothetical protein
MATRQSTKLKQARARAAKKSRECPNKKIYINKDDGEEETYSISGVPSIPMTCYKNGNEIAL